MPMKISASGKPLFSRSRTWNGDAEVVATAIYAGQYLELMPCEDGTPGYELHFLGLKSEPFPSPKNAKDHALGYALQVLRHLAEMLES